MANNIDIISCSHANFLKYLEESKPTDQTFKDIFNQFNEKYINLSKEIYQINEVRSEILTKIKSAQQEYKRLLGHGEIKPVIDINDDEELDKPAVQENKVPDKRGRKKADVKDSVAASKEKPDEAVVLDIVTELENIPKMKTKVAKETKKTKVEPVKQTETDEDEEQNDNEDKEQNEDDDEVEQAPVTTTKKVSVQSVVKKVPVQSVVKKVPVQSAVKKITKSIKKTVPGPEAEADADADAEAEAEIEPEEVQEEIQQVKPPVKAKKVVPKSVKNVIPEAPVEELEEIQEVKPKTSIKKKNTK